MPCSYSKYQKNARCHIPNGVGKNVGPYWSYPWFFGLNLPFSDTPTRHHAQLFQAFCALASLALALKASSLQSERMLPQLGLRSSDDADTLGPIIKNCESTIKTGGGGNQPSKWRYNGMWAYNGISNNYPWTWWILTKIRHPLGCSNGKKMQETMVVNCGPFWAFLWMLPPSKSGKNMDKLSKNDVCKWEDSQESWWITGVPTNLRLVW